MKKLILTLLMSMVNFSLLFAQGNMEFRAIWVVDSQWLSNTTTEGNKAKTRQILDHHRQANLNAVLWQIRRFGNVYYPSAIEPWGKATGFRDPGYDPLAYAIQEAHARGLEFHAWLNVFESRNMFPGSPAQKHPEWVCRDQNGKPMPAELAWLSPGLPEVRQYLVRVAMEIVRNYDIDGLHLDFVRWNEHTSSGKAVQLAKLAQKRQLPDGIITEEQLAELQANPAGRYLYDVQHPYDQGVPEGFATWEDWWRWSVTEFVKTLHDSIQAVKPWVRLSPAALGRYNWGGWNGYNTVYQDAALWFNEGYIDQLAGMHYHWTRPDEFLSVLVTGGTQSWSQFIQPGIAAGRLYTVGLFSDNFLAKNTWNSHEAILKAVRNVRWVDGFQFFSYASWEEKNYWHEAANRLFKGKAKIRPVVKSPTPLDAPTLTLTRLDSLHYKIALNPPANASSEHWYAIYRSKDNQFSTSSDQIVDLFFGSGSHEFIDQFSGTQDYNGKYYYFATVLDRYWNESAISNADQSDAIPSFAPVVVSTNPAEGDTIPVNVPIIVEFTKTMNSSSAENSIQFTPSLSIGQLNWSENNKTLTILPAAPFAFATQYTLTIKAALTDINGRAIDGNADGQEGDDFILHFSTQEKDVTGPEILASYPDSAGHIDNFDVEDIVTVAFSEIIDVNSFKGNMLNLAQDGDPLDFGYQMTRTLDKSVLGIQPTHPFTTNSDYTLTFSGEIADTVGNLAQQELRINFTTSPNQYAEIQYIDKFFSASNWWQPGQSGSTVGTIKTNTSFKMSAGSYLPASSPRQRISAALTYEWDESSTEHLIRVFLVQGQPRNVLFDTTFVLQCYIFSDGSGNKFRFAVDDSTKDQSAFHEVSKWVTLDWYGWRLIEWQLNDPNGVGEWIGDGILNGPSLRFDSFQMTHPPGAAKKGTIYLDNLRLAKKTRVPVSVKNKVKPPAKFVLYQNYPNPFNPTTWLSFDLPQAGPVKFIVYDILGREVKTLIDQPMTAGFHRIQFDGNGLASGVYVYQLTFDGQVKSKRMLLTK